MRVEDGAAVGFDAADQPVLVLHTLPACEHQAEGGLAAVHHRELLVLPDLVAKAHHLTLDDGRIEGLRIGHLQVGKASVDLQHLQRGVVVGALVGGGQACRFEIGLAHRHGHLAAAAGDQIAQCLQRGRCNHREHRVPVRRKAAAEHRVVGRETRIDGRQQEAVQRRLARRDAEVQHLAVAREQRDHVHPVHCRRQRHLHLGDDAVGPVGVVHLLDVVALQGDHARLGLHRHDAAAQQVAAVTQHAMRRGPDAAEAPGDEARDRGHTPGAGPDAQRLAGFAHGHLNVVHARAALHPHPARADVQHALHAGDVDDQTAGQGHALPVVARASPSHRQRQAVAGRYRSHLQHVVLGAHTHHEVGHAVVQHLGECRAVPEEILGQRTPLAD